MKRSVLFVAVLGFAGGAHAADAPRVALTIYNNNLAYIQEDRTLDLPAGRSSVEFRDVSAAIRPETVTLAARGVQIVEQNFDFDLLTPQKVMEKAVGEQIQIVRTNPGNGAQQTETATVLSATAGVVLKVGDHIEVLRDDGVPTRVLFDRLPENLRPKPTLSVTLNADRAGARPAQLSYLTRGLSWKADYVALFDESKKALDLQGWITLTNRTGSSFKDAEAKLVAGDVSLADSPEEYYRREQNRRAMAANLRPGTEQASAQGVGDLYVYPLAQRTSVENNQTKQVGFLTASSVQASKVYRYVARSFESPPAPQNAEVAVRFANAKAAGLGAPLPAGIVRVYMRDGEGEPKFVGESPIDHTPQGSELSVKTGEAFDVTVQATTLGTERLSAGARYRMSYVFRNARRDPVTIDFRQQGLWRTSRMIQESQPGRRIDVRSLGWDVTVPANGETTLTFVVETGG